MTNNYIENLTFWYFRTYSGLGFKILISMEKMLAIAITKSEGLLQIRIGLVFYNARVGSLSGRDIYKGINF